MTQSPRIIIVDDEAPAREMVGDYLKMHGFSVTLCDGGTSLRDAIETGMPDLVVLDLNMPEEDGLSIIRDLKSRSNVPVIMLTATASPIDRVVGLELGADDYIAKPFSPRELVARVKAVLRRFERPLPPSPMKVGDIEIDPSAMTLTVRGQTVATTATEFRLLDYFARHKGRVFSRDHLLDSVWRDTAYVTPRSVDVYVRRIREKIEPDPENPRYLKTVRGAGYRFESPK
jgi:two-component system phosphate regulon response regulator PhoB